MSILASVHQLRWAAATVFGLRCPHVMCCAAFAAPPLNCVLNRLPAAGRAWKRGRARPTPLASFLFRRAANIYMANIVDTLRDASGTLAVSDRVLSTAASYHAVPVRSTCTPSRATRPAQRNAAY